jgi:hypothetical protein
MYRSLPSAMEFAKRIMLPEGRGLASFIHEQLRCYKSGIIRPAHDDGVGRKSGREQVFESAEFRGG